MNVFKSTDILLPQNVNMEQWSVIACDQFTSDPAYWQRVRATAGDGPSTIHLILPEAELGGAGEQETVQAINAAMERYLKEQVFAVYPNSYVYVERTLTDGSVHPVCWVRWIWKPMTITLVLSPPFALRSELFWSGFHPASGCAAMQQLSCPMC